MNFAPVDVAFKLNQLKKKWLVTGGAGFIGAHIVETLLSNGQSVCVLDNFSTGFKANLELVQKNVGSLQSQNLTIIEGDIRDFDVCLKATINIDYVLHQAAFISVPLSIERPRECFDVNQIGTQNLLRSSVENKIKKIVYASSAAVYGEEPTLPKSENLPTQVLSPYAQSKKMNEDDAELFYRQNHLATVGLRYFNVFGSRQDPFGAYASVIPRWIQLLKEKKNIQIYGQGDQTRDFCHVSQIVQANIRAAISDNALINGEVFNVGLGRQTSLNQLLQMIYSEFGRHSLDINLDLNPVYLPERAGDIKHSFASIEKAVRMLDFKPTWTLEQGLAETIDWYLQT
jgi:UDP-N-acetylglucosamine 4-epimerase